MGSRVHRVILATPNYQTALTGRPKPLQPPIEAFQWQRHPEEVQHQKVTPSISDKSIVRKSTNQSFKVRNSSFLHTDARYRHRFENAMLDKTKLVSTLSFEKRVYFSAAGQYSLLQMRTDSSENRCP